MQRVKVTRRVRKGSTAIMLDYTADGKRVQRVFGSASSPEALAIVEAEAEKEARRLEVQLMDGLYRPSVGDKPVAAVLADFLEYAEHSKRREGTLACYRNAVAKFKRFLETTKATRARDVTPELICQFIRSQDTAQDTIRLSIATLGAAFTRAVDKGDMLTNPVRHPDVRGLKPSGRKHERTFTDEEFETLLAAALTVGRERQDFADYLLCLGQSGLRLSEGLMLRWCDVSLDDGRPFLRVQPREGWNPKTKHSIRRVPLSPRVLDMLRRRLRAAGTFNPTARIFPAEWTVNTMDVKFNNVLRAAVLHERDEASGDKLRIHSLRHYYASFLVRSGADPATVRDLCGHASIEQTNRYFTLPADAMFDAVSRAYSRHRNVTGTGEILPFPSENYGNTATGGKG